MTQPPQFPEQPQGGGVPPWPGSGDGAQQPHPEQPANPYAAYGAPTGGYPQGSFGYVESTWESNLRLLEGDGRFSLKEALNIGMVQLVRNGGAWAIIALLTIVGSFILAGIGFVVLLFGFVGGASVLSEGDVEEVAALANTFIVGIVIMMLLIMVLYAFVTPFFTGLAIKHARGLRATVGQSKPEGSYWSCFVATLLVQLPMLVVVALVFSGMGNLLANFDVLDNASGADLFSLVIGPVMAAMGILLVYVLLSPFVALWPYITVATGQGVVASLQTTLRVGAANYFRLLGLFIVFFLLSVAGSLVFNIGNIPASYAMLITLGHVALRVTGEKYAALPSSANA